MTLSGVSSSRLTEKQTASHKKGLFMKRLFSIAIILLSSALAVAAQDIIGDWNGKLNVNGGELRLVLHITKNADGSLKGTVIT